MYSIAQSVFQKLMSLSELSLPGEPAQPEEGVDASIVGSTAEEILTRMTLDEKITLLAGYKSFAIAPVPRLGVPPVWMSDATGGLRLFGGGTSFPCAMAMAATWNPRLIEATAEQIGAEFRSHGIALLLGPGVNICRLPTGGRNFEYFSEDPHLSGVQAVSYIRGLRKSGVEAVVKHFACNNSDYDRHRENARVDERVLREIYLPAFRAAVKEGEVQFVMTSYNQLNGVYTSEHPWLLKTVLRDEWGFSGVVMSDWTSTYSTVDAMRNGLGLEMPGPKRFAPGKIKQALRQGKITPEELDERVSTTLSTCLRCGFYDKRDQAKAADPIPATPALLSAAVEGIVLLKNSGVLPLQRRRVKRIVVTGSCARGTDTGGGGSSYVKAKKSIDILTGIQRAVKPETEVMYLPRKKRLYKKDYPIITSADVVIACIGFDHIRESEGYDRRWRIPEGGDNLVRELSERNPTVVTVLTGGGAMEMASWLKAASAVLHSFYLGEQVGTAVAAVLFGDENPSGRLPVTIPVDFADVKAANYYYKKPWKVSLARTLGPQGIRGIRRIKDLSYGEGLGVGYRGFQRDGIKPLFPFGFGLSYTQFEYKDLHLESRRITKEDLQAGKTVALRVTVRNEGTFPGAEVVQVYVQKREAPPADAGRALKGFSKVPLQPGNEGIADITLSRDSFARFDESEGGWVLERGEYSLMVCRHAEEPILEDTFTIL
ncbi:MAG: glycoside hydrolase family 3 protein [Spirochaetales bacterium]|nr:glycoside hydrolase family 3 protein [Spirochaetales bacterium]